MASDPPMPADDRARLQAAREKARQIRDAGDVPHYSEDGPPIGLAEYVALAESGRVSAARFSLRTP